MAHPLRIQPVKLRRGGLDSVRAEVPLAVEQWRDGVDYTSQCNVGGGRWGCGGRAFPGGTIADANKDPFAMDDDATRFNPTLLYASTGCTVAGTQTIIGDVITQIGEQALDRIRWAELANLLYDGEVGGDATNLGFKDAQLVPGQSLTDPVGILPTLQGMLEFPYDARDQQLVLHVPQHFLGYFLNQHLVEWDGTNYRLGANLIVSFDDYVNRGPDESINDIPAADEFWMYLTAQPLISLDAVHVRGTLTAQQNLYDVVAEQGVIALLDPCVLVAAKALVCN